VLKIHNTGCSVSAVAIEVNEDLTVVNRMLIIIYASMMGRSF
jgi:hypothetical protein